MTKYVLVGGADRKYELYGKQLATEIFKTVKKPVNVLSCFFAEPREEWEVKFAQRQGWFRKILGEDTVCSLAFPDAFQNQVQQANVVYLHGGDDVLLAHYMQSYDDKTLFRDKIVVGSSAGANWLAKNFWTCDWRESGKGSGLTNLNIIPHYESEEYGVNDPRGPIDWQKAAKDLQIVIGADEKIALLREGEFIVEER